MKPARSTFSYEAKEKPVEKLQEGVNLRHEVERMCWEFPRYGYRWVTR